MLDKQLTNLETIVSLGRNIDDGYFQYIKNADMLTQKIDMPKECNEMIISCLKPMIDELKEQIEKLD